MGHLDSYIIVKVIVAIIMMYQTYIGQLLVQLTSTYLFFTEFHGNLRVKLIEQEIPINA